MKNSFIHPLTKLLLLSVVLFLVLLLADDGSANSNLIRDARKITTAAPSTSVTCPATSTCRSRTCCGYLCPTTSTAGNPVSCGVILGIRPTCIDNVAGPIGPATRCLQDTCATCAINSIGCAGSPSCAAVPTGMQLCDFSRA